MWRYKKAITFLYTIFHLYFGGWVLFGLGFAILDWSSGLTFCCDASKKSVAVFPNKFGAILVGQPENKVISWEINNYLATFREFRLKKGIEVHGQHSVTFTTYMDVFTTSYWVRKFGLFQCFTSNKSFVSFAYSGNNRKLI